jgi:hypothetical protein
MLFECVSHKRLTARSSLYYVRLYDYSTLVLNVKHQRE